MKRSARLAPSFPVADRSRSRASWADNTTAASSEDPITFSRRASSSTADTSSLSFISLSHAGADSESRAASSRVSKRARWTDSSFVPGRAVQTSSAVNGRTGAARVARARAMRCMTVWADRRSGEAGAEA